jgi:hypothetical protein
LTYRFATAADLRRFYGEQPSETIQAMVVLNNDEPQIVMGLAYRKDCVLLFSDYKPEAWEFRSSTVVGRAIKKIMTLVSQCKRPVYSVRQEGSDLLDRLGFVPVSEDLYRWPS